MKIIFMGTPDFSVPVLEALCAHHEVAAVYTRAPKESGRGKKINKTPVHLCAEAHNIPVFTPKSLRSEEVQAEMRAFGADLGVVAAYGLILPQGVLDMFPKGCINVHASLLPRWRGAAPIQRAIAAGDKESGITIMQMALALDAGDMLSQATVKIEETTTGGALHDQLSEKGAELLIDTLARLDKITPQKQDEKLVTYAEKIDKNESLMDFGEDTATLLNKIHAFNPYPAMYFMYRGERFKVYEGKAAEADVKEGEIKAEDKRLFIGTRDGAIEVMRIQREGKQEMTTEELLRGFKF